MAVQCSRCGSRHNTKSDLLMHSCPNAPTSAENSSPSTGLEGLSNSELADAMEMMDKPSKELRYEAARRLRLRVPTGSDAEILERAADKLNEWYPKADGKFDLRKIAENLRALEKSNKNLRFPILRSEQNTQKPTKEKDANGI